MKTTNVHIYSWQKLDPCECIKLSLEPMLIHEEGRQMLRNTGRMTKHEFGNETKYYR